MIKEDKLPPKLPVVLSSEISRRISAIDTYTKTMQMGFTNGTITLKG